MNENAIVLEYEGYSTFNDVEDCELRNYNRGHIIINIIEDLTSRGMREEVCWAKVEEYMKCIDPAEKYKVYRGLAMAKNMRTNEPTAFGYN